MLTRVALILLTAASLLAQTPSAAPAEQSCRRHPQLVGKCFNVRGRLSIYNGAPAARIWKIGTRRMLGVSEQRFAIPGYRNLPESLAKKLDSDTEIFADFRVCPFTPNRPGEMQMVCVESAQNVRIKTK